MHISRITVALAIAACCVTTWLVAGLQLAEGILGVLPFVAPGAMIGIALGWLSYLFLPRAYTWRHGRRDALRGAALLPPWLAALVTAGGMTIGGGVMVVVGGAWTVVFVGATAALLRWASWRLTCRRAAPELTGVFLTERRKSARLRARSRIRTFPSSDARTERGARPVPP
jgi:hypothetical protein